MLSVVTFKWATPGYRTAFTAGHVNALRRAVERHYDQPHRFLCITDDAEGIHPGVEIVPLWNDFADVPSPHGGQNPSCYRRLKLFDPAIASIIGPRFVALDLDCVVTGPLVPLFDRTGDFVMWRDAMNVGGYNGSLMLMDAGARRQVWTEFDPCESPRRALAAGCMGSDQAWIRYCLGPNESTVGPEDGVYSYRTHVRGMQSLPANAKLIFFHGRVKPWDDEASKHAWVRAACQ